MGRRVIFDPNAKDEYEYWKKENAKIVERIRELIGSIKKDPFKGLGKPEPLKHGLQGYWSRRIDKVNRLVYAVKNDEIIVISCRHHYEKYFNL